MSFAYSLLLLLNHTNQTWTSNHLHFYNLTLAVSSYLLVHITSVTVFFFCVVNSVSDIRGKSTESASLPLVRTKTFQNKHTSGHVVGCRVISMWVAACRWYIKESSKFHCGFRRNGNVFQTTWVPNACLNSFGILQNNTRHYCELSCRC